jgi:hypothetical protein
MKVLKRSAFVAAIAVAALLSTAAPALAATSEMRAPSGAGYAWYNAGTHYHVGRNLFTVKDDICGDGHRPFVYYEIYDRRTQTSQGYQYSGRLANGWVGPAGDCGGEVNISVYGPTATTDYITWVAARRNLSTGKENYGYPWRHDTVW